MILLFLVGGYDGKDHSWSVSLEHLHGLLTEHCRRLLSYTSVSSDTFRVDFRDGSVCIKLREPYEDKCWMRDGKGKGSSYYDYDDPSPIC